MYGGTYWPERGTACDTNKVRNIDLRYLLFVLTFCDESNWIVAKPYKYGICLEMSYMYGICLEMSARKVCIY